MSSIGTLWTTPTQTTGKYIRAAAAYADLKLDLPEHYTHFEDNKKSDFLAKFPHGKIPALETKDGFKLFETFAIARYVASLAPNSTLLGSSPQEAALVDQWVSFALSEVLAPIETIQGLLRGRVAPYSKPIHQTLTERATRGLRTLNGHLQTRTFIVGERPTLADFANATMLQAALTTLLDAPLRAELPNLVRFFETVANHPKVKDVYGATEYVAAALQYVPPPKEKKEPKPQAAPQPKAEKKPKKKEVEEEEDFDDTPVEEPKPKNPLDLLPKSSFNLEDWKRAYSNLDTRGKGGSLEWFYERFDKDGFSIWRVDFKYPEELTQVFMSSNLIGGFFNRLEASRKYLFGSVGVLGTTNNSLISGVFILRGQDAKPVVEVAPDWESYDFRRLDLANPADKVFFEAALAWDLEVDGKAWADGKNFK